MADKKGQPHLMAQDAKTVDPSKLTALTPEVVRRRILIYVYFYNHPFHGVAYSMLGVDRRA